jgi:hypothetical protein
MEGFASKGLYTSSGVSVVTRTKNPEESLRDILSDVIKPFVDTHTTILLISLARV